jgi:hypothetical protein
MKNKITLLDIKQAMKDSRFRDSLSPEFQEDVKKYLSNPGCQCNNPIYLRIIKECKKQIQEYYPNKEIVLPEEELQAANHWMVINCKVEELEKKLKELNPLHKQISMARYQDQITVVINEF